MGVDAALKSESDSTDLSKPLAGTISLSSGKRSDRYVCTSAAF